MKVTTTSPSSRRALSVFSLVFLAFSHPSSGQGTPMLSMGEMHQIESQVLGETRTYFVDKPRDYDFSRDEYPLVVLLDAETQFRHVSATAELLAENGRIPAVLVVGVVNVDRRRDTNPPDPGYDDSRADKFLTFITDELIPKIEREHRTRPHRVLIGHSSAGVFAVYSLLKQPDAFDGYIVVAPSFGDHRSIVKDVESFIVAHRDLRADLYITIANEGGSQLGGAWELSSILQEKAPSDVRWQFHRYPEETHESVPLLSVYDGLQAIYDGWYIHDSVALYNQAGISGLEKHYAAVSARMGYRVEIPETVLTEVFYPLLYGQRLTEAAAVVERALSSYPNSADVHFAAGRLYAGQKNEPKTIEQLTETLKLDPSFGAARRMLASYKVDVSQILPEVSVPDRILDSYAGRYRAPDSGASMEITRQDHKLLAASTLGAGEIRPLSETRFYSINGESQISFQKDSHGNVDGLIVLRGGADFAFARVVTPESGL